MQKCQEMKLVKIVVNQPLYVSIARSGTLKISVGNYMGALLLTGVVRLRQLAVPLSVRQPPTQKTTPVQIDMTLFECDCTFRYISVPMSNWYY